MGLQPEPGRQQTGPGRMQPLLLMRRPGLDGLPVFHLPAPYELRTYRPGDDLAWAELMNTGIGRDWTAASAANFLMSRPQFSANNLFFATQDERPVGTACAWWLDPRETTTGYLHMVCVHPEHRGSGLGFWLSLRVLHRFKELGFRDAILRTDDFRLAAIAQYLQLGFQPEHDDSTHPDRWQALLKQLAIG